MIPTRLIPVPLRLLLALAMLCLAHSLQAQTTTLFEVSDGQSRVLLGGTIHLLHPSDFPLPRAFDTAYEEADKLYLETDLAIVESPGFGQQMAQAMLYPAGKNLKTELSPQVWQEVEHYAEANRFPIQQFLGFDPVFVSILMTVMKAQSLGIQEGVDQHYYQKARIDGLPLGELESSEEVLAYMQGMTDLDPDAVMQATLEELKDFDKLMGETVEAWREGDLEALDRDLGEPMRRESPELYQKLLVDRNAQWLPKIERMFQQPGTELVLVGSLHLAGKHSLLDMMKQQGYRIQPYRPPE